MLVFTRKVGDQILIGEDIELTVEKIGKSHVDIGISAPNEYTIQRRQVETCTPDANESDINQQMPSV